MGRAPASRSGFTLVEILVSLALMAFLLATATYAFSQVKKMTERIQARQAMHNTARQVYERFRGEISALHQGGAFYLRSSGTGDDIELVFLSGRYDLRDFDGPAYDQSEEFTVDHLWSRWHWGGPGQPLTAARNRPLRRFTLTDDWSPDGAVNYKGQTFAIIAQARREAGPDAATSLDRNAFGTPSPADRGDYSDLLDQAQPLALACTDLALEVVLTDGSVITAQPDVATSHAIDGLSVDGAVGGNRPRLIRIRFSLRDARLDLEEPFSFSIQAPGVLPP